MDSAMNTRTRRAFTLAQLLLTLAGLALLFAQAVPAVARVRFADAKGQSANNLKLIGLALHNYHDTVGHFPSGNDENNFSALAYLLPYIEQGKLYEQIDFTKAMDDKANAEARKTVVKVFVNPADKGAAPNANYGPTNYLLCAGANPGLVDNNGVFYQASKLSLAKIAAADGTANTVMAGETLKGGGAAKEPSLKRQHVALKKDDLKGIKDDAGVKEWKDGKNIAGDRGASWMDGRFLQTTFTGTRTLNDEKPDVNCDGFGGLSGLRVEEDSANLLFADGSVRAITSKSKLEVWKALAGWNDGLEVPDF
jgi:prepilin-type processing-associated H-X9-DG protein